ncbi:hypothetical protein [Natronorubrum sp. FCH18a]|uniref:hypothetical protein n=1 Tax=Natronorubrum sp. FCH18a TaxID=3447018 RepID=UPI003F50F13C
MCPTFTDDEVSKPVVNDADEEIGVVTSVEGDIAHVRPETDAVGSITSSIGWDSVAEETQPLSSDSVREITDDAVRLEGGLPTTDDDPASEPESAVGTDDREGTSEPATEPAGGSAGIEETEVAEDLHDETDEETDSIHSAEGTATDAERPDSVDERGTDRGLEADPTELAKQEPEAEFNPGDTSSRTDAGVEPDDDHRSTDAAVDLDDDPRRTDAAVDPGEQPRRTDAEMDPDAIRDADTDDSGPTTEDAGRGNLEDGPEEQRIGRDEESEADDLERDDES